jgi:PAS domain S-box-containing protein
MKLQDIRDFMFGTLRGRIILGVALVHAVMMTLFIIDLTIRQRNTLRDRQVEEVTALARSLSISAAIWIKSEDVSGLQELVESQRRYPELMFAILTDERGLILAHTDRNKQGLYLQDLPAQVHKPVLIETPELVEVLVPALLNNRIVGWTCVGISRKSASEKLTEIVLSGIFYAIVAIAIGSLIAWWMGLRFTRRLYAVQDTISEVKSGNRSARSNITGVDEAAAIASEFNTMLDTLDEQRISLLKGETKYQMLLWSIRVGVVVHDSDTQILMSNPMAQELLGLSEKQMLGKTAVDPAWHFLKEDGSVMPIEEYPVNRTIATSQPLKDLIVGVHRPDREIISWLLVNTEVILDEQNETSDIIITFVDITERKRAEEDLNRINRELQAISICNQAMMRADDEQTLLNEVCNIISHEAGYRLVWVGYAENDDAKTIRPVAWAGFDNEYVSNAKLSWSDQTERGCGPGGESFRSGKIVYIQDFTTDPRMAPWRKSALQRGYRSVIALPLKDENTNVFGVLLIYSTEINAFTPEELHLLEELADDLTFGIIVLRARNESKQAEKEIKNKSKELQTANAELSTSNKELEVVNKELITTNIELQKTKETLKISESILKKAQQMAQIGNWEYDAATGKVLGSDEFFRIYGLTPSPGNEIKIDEVAACIPERARIRPALMDLINYGTPYNYEFVIHPANGEAARVIHSIANRIMIENGTANRAIGVIQDITERKHAEEEIHKLNQELEHRVALRTAELEVINKELESFAYSVSHDLRTPLRSIDGFSQLLLDEYQAQVDAKGKNYLQRVRSASQYMAQLIDDMLNLSRVSRTEMRIEQVNLSEIAHEIVSDLLEIQADCKVEFIIQDGIKVQGDSHLLHIVLENLLGNAWKFTSKHAIARIEFGMQLQEEVPVYFVRDNGAGFNMEYAEKLFGAFQRLHSATEFPGTGIGLANVQRVIHRHGGNVWAEGEVGKGATFYFTLQAKT